MCAACARLAPRRRDLYFEVVAPSTDRDDGQAERPQILVICAKACCDCVVTLELRAMNFVVVHGEGGQGGLLGAGVHASPDAVLALVDSSCFDADLLVQDIRRHPALEHVPVMVGPSCAEESPSRELAALIAATVSDARSSGSTAEDDVRSAPACR